MNLENDSWWTTSFPCSVRSQRMIPFWSKRSSGERGHVCSCWWLKLPNVWLCCKRLEHYCPGLQGGNFWDDLPFWMSRNPCGAQSQVEQTNFAEGGDMAKLLACWLVCFPPVLCLSCPPFQGTVTCHGLRQCQTVILVRISILWDSKCYWSGPVLLKVI